MLVLSSASACRSSMSANTRLRDHRSPSVLDVRAVGIRGRSLRRQASIAVRVPCRTLPNYPPGRAARVGPEKLFVARDGHSASALRKAMPESTRAVTVASRERNSARSDDLRILKAGRERVSLQRRTGRPRGGVRRVVCKKARRGSGRSTGPDQELTARPLENVRIDAGAGTVKHLNAR